MKRAYEAVKIDGEVKGELVQYAEYAEWQNQLLAETSEIAGRGRSYWQQQHQRAAGAVRRDGTVEKLADKSQSNIRGQVRRKLSREIVKRLEEIGFRHGANLEEILLASWMTLIRGLEGNEDVVVGATVDGRKYGELEGALGLYSRNVPIYCCIEEGSCFADILQQVSEAKQEAGEWQEFYEATESEEAEEGTVKSPLYTICFDFESWPSGHSSSNGVSISLLKRHVTIGHSRLRLSCTRVDDHLWMEFDYDSQDFCSETVERIAGHFEKLLSNLVDGFDRLVDELEILTDSDLRRLNVEFNQTASDYFREAS